MFFLAAAKVGGILANQTYPGDFIRENLLIQTHVIDAACRHGVKVNVPGLLVHLSAACAATDERELPPVRTFGGDKFGLCAWQKSQA